MLNRAMKRNDIYLNEFHRQQHEKAKTLLSKRPRQSLADAMKRHRPLLVAGKPELREYIPTRRDVVGDFEVSLFSDETELPETAVGAVGIL